MIYNLFLDDERVPADVTWVELPLVNWVVATNYNEFLRLIKDNGLPARISFDHDLADEHYQEYTRAAMCGMPFKYHSMREKTGYHCCKWLIEYCLEKNLPLPECYIHTMNPIGRANIQSLLDSYRKVCNTES